MPPIGSDHVLPSSTGIDVMPSCNSRKSRRPGPLVIGMLDAKEASRK